NPLTAGTARLHGMQVVVMKSSSTSSPGRPDGNARVAPVASTSRNSDRDRTDFDCDGPGVTEGVGTAGPGMFAAGGRPIGSAVLVVRSGRAGGSPGSSGRLSRASPADGSGSPVPLRSSGSGRGDGLPDGSAGVPP